MGNGGEDSQKRIVINFIDPLFSVVLAASFAQIYVESWFKNFWLIWQEPNLFTVSTLVLLGYATVILSWVGYHQSINSNPIKVETRAGRWRFGLDVVLLIAYFVLLVSYDNFRRELWVVSFIYLIFVIWDQLKRLEAKPGLSHEVRLEMSARRGVTVFWFVAYMLLAAFYEWFPPQTRYECKDWNMLIAAVTGTILYRVHKKRLWLKRFLYILGYPRPHA